MDYFVLFKDSFYQVMQEGFLYWSFMGYILFMIYFNLVLGVFFISDSWGVFVQNEKKIECYYELVNVGELFIVKGYFLMEEDCILWQYIFNIMCCYWMNWADVGLQCEAFYVGLDCMDELEVDGFIIWCFFEFEVIDIGKLFICNICMVFDVCYWCKKFEGQFFSQVVQALLKLSFVNEFFFFY